MFKKEGFLVKKIYFIKISFERLPLEMIYIKAKVLMFEGRGFQILKEVSQCDEYKL